VGKRHFGEIEPEAVLRGQTEEQGVEAAASTNVAERSLHLDEWREEWSPPR